MARRASLGRAWRAYMQFLRGLGGDEPQSLESRIISAIARRGVVAKEELRGIAGSHQVVLRQVLSILRGSGLAYYRRYCRNCYVVSMPWVFFAKSVLGEGWRDWLRRRAPGISDAELGELEEWLRLSEAEGEELEELGEEERRLAGRLRRVRLFAESRLETLRLMSSLVRVVPELLPESCSRPPSETLRGLIKNGASSVDQLRNPVIQALDKWFLGCYVVPVLEYTPFLLRLLAGLAYSYATGYDPRRYAAELRLHARHWREIACGGLGCHEFYERLVDETFGRLLALLEHLRKVREGTASIKTLLDQYNKEWVSEGISGQKLSNHRSVVARFLAETFQEFYTWLPYIVEELEATV